MFTGIIESLGKSLSIDKKGTNMHFKFSCDFLDELKIDQSLSHNGVCLTITKIDEDGYWVTAVEETLLKTNMGQVIVGDYVNLERCMVANGRFDGHIVQGHVDQLGECKKVEDREGSWIFSFEFKQNTNGTIVEKGSITINGVSLTCFNVTENGFQVTIIPYTHEHTTFKYVKAGSKVNLEFDIIGKYVKSLADK